MVLAIVWRDRPVVRQRILNPTTQVRILIPPPHQRKKEGKMSARLLLWVGGCSFLLAVALLFFLGVMQIHNETLIVTGFVFYFGGFVVALAGAFFSSGGFYR
jgi:drug/metabolite transporter (DMT)-like permease